MVDPFFQQAISVATICILSNVFALMTCTKSEKKVILAILVYILVSISFHLLIQITIWLVLVCYYWVVDKSHTISDAFGLGTSVFTKNLWTGAQSAYLIVLVAYGLVFAAFAIEKLIKPTLFDKMDFVSRRNRRNSLSNTSILLHYVAVLTIFTILLMIVLYATSVLNFVPISLAILVTVALFLLATFVLFARFHLRSDLLLELASLGALCITPILYGTYGI